MAQWTAVTGQTLYGQQIYRRPTQISIDIEGERVLVVYEEALGPDKIKLGRSSESAMSYRLYENLWAAWDAGAAGIAIAAGIAAVLAQAEPQAYIDYLNEHPELIQS